MICSGAGAFESLRVEKGYRSLGSDIHTNYNPYESGLGFTVKLKKDEDFIGKSALQKIKEKILSINENYKFSTLNGHIENDVLIAYL